MALDYSNSQSLSYEAGGTLDRDISEVIVNITPDKTPFLSSMHVGEDAREMKIEWHADELRPARKNQRPELDSWNTFEKAAGVGMGHNYVQIFRNDGMVSDIMQKVHKTYNPKTNELDRQKVIKMKEMAKDMEYAIVVNAVSNAEHGSTLAMMGGLPCYLKEELIDVTLNESTGVFTTATDHHRLTGDFVVFVAGTDALPTELEANQMYFIKQETSNPTKAFKVFNSLEDAVEGVKGITFAGGSTLNLKVKLNNAITAQDKLFNKTHINQAMRLATYRGGDPTDAWMSPSNKSRFSEVMGAINVVNRDQGDKRVTEVVSTYDTDYGTITAHAHREMSDNTIFLLDNNYWSLRYLDKPHVIDESKLGKDGSYTKFVITAAMTMEAKQPLASAAITDIARPSLTE